MGLLPLRSRDLSGLSVLSRYSVLSVVLAVRQAGGFKSHCYLQTGSVDIWTVPNMRTDAPCLRITWHWFMCECLPILLFFIRQRSLRSSGMLRGKIQTFVQIYRTSSSREEIKAEPHACITHPDRTPKPSPNKGEIAIKSFALANQRARVYFLLHLFFSAL